MKVFKKLKFIFHLYLIKFMIEIFLKLILDKDSKVYYNFSFKKAICKNHKKNLGN